MTRYFFPVLVIALLTAIVYLIVQYDLYWFVSAFTRTPGAGQ